jgi:hypothetical protein
MATLLGAIKGTSEKKGIARGDYSVKEHLSNGRKTACNRNSLNKLDKEQFIYVAKNFPERCCENCLRIAKQRRLI